MKKIIKSKIRALRIAINTFDCQPQENQIRRAKINLLESILEEKESEKNNKSKQINASVKEIVQEYFPCSFDFNIELKFNFNSMYSIESNLKQELFNAKTLKEIIDALKKI